MTTISTVNFVRGGKSSIARLLAERLGTTILNFDPKRDAKFYNAVKTTNIPDDSKIRKEGNQLIVETDEELMTLTSKSNKFVCDFGGRFDDRLADFPSDAYIVPMMEDFESISESIRATKFVLAHNPEAKIIHVNRNPAAVCWSNYKYYFPANGMRYSFDMEDIAHYYGLYQDLMQFWHGAFPNRIYDLTYETLTENQLEETQKLLTYLKLDWQDAVMDFHKNTRSVATASSQQVRTKMYKGSSHEWERYKEHLGPMLNILNNLPKS